MTQGHIGAPREGERIFRAWAAYAPNACHAGLDPASIGGLGAEPTGPAPKA
jgi:hypothetical protein